MAQKIILDTDIGDDIDDVLALALICGSPELELLGVTTVYGNTPARARQAQTALYLAGEKFRSIPVCAGCGASLTSRPMGDNWQKYLSGVRPNQDATCLPEKQLGPLDPRHGLDFLIETILAGDGDIIPVTIGAMTNMAMAMVKEPKILAKIPRIVAMAAEFQMNHAEWNILCDPEAASLVFRSGIPMDVVTFHAGLKATWDTHHVERLAASTAPLAKNLSAAISAWQRFNKNQELPHLYDPLAVAATVRPDLVTWRSGTVHVELGGQKNFGFTRIEGAEGPHRVTTDVDREAALEFCLERILSLGAAA